MFADFDRSKRSLHRQSQPGRVLDRSQALKYGELRNSR
jgi:hypothetical protein